MKNLILLFTFIASINTHAKKVDPREVANTEHPNKLLFLVFDQMRPDYIDRYNLKNFKRVIKDGRNYPEAYVGHANSITVVSHPVMTTGLAPKNFPWVDNVMWDKNGIFGEKGLTYQSTNLTLEQYEKALKNLPKEKSLAFLLTNKLKKDVYSIGEKSYSTITMGGPWAHSLITMHKKNGRCTPAGRNVPDYITNDKRFDVDCSEDHGTKNSYYPLDGHHYYFGKDKTGGDVWAADVALKVMNNENWGALFITFGAIDKFAHMMGEVDKKIPLNFKSPASIQDVLKVADEQLGRLLAQLEKDNQLKDTMIVITADHGGQSNLNYLGPGHSELYGELANRSGSSSYSKSLTPIYESGLIRIGYADTSIRLWLKSTEKSATDLVTKALQKIPEVTRVFLLSESGHEYHEVLSHELRDRLAKQPKRFQKWAKAHDLELLNTMANPTAPNVVALLQENSGYGLLGAHGGNQEFVQRIPMIISGPGISKGIDKKPLRLVDLRHYITEAMGL